MTCIIRLKKTKQGYNARNKDVEYKHIRINWGRVGDRMHVRLGVVGRVKYIDSIWNLKQ